MRNISALIAGLVFGIGLTVAQMTNPAKVIGFLDLFGSWDASLAFVMGGALVVTAIGYRLVTKNNAPVFADRFDIPTSQTVDVRLAAGSVLFGIGWALAGLCPGPAIAAISIGGLPIAVFLVAMFAGSGLYQLLQSKQSASLTQP